MVERLLDVFGSLPGPEILRGAARRRPGMLAPTSQMRALRELEPPNRDEGLADVERRVFARVPPSGVGRAGVLVAAAALRHPGWHDALATADQGAPHLVFEWSPEATPGALVPCVESLAAEISGSIDSALCPHPAGPPTCWCRPPLPGLPLAFARARGVDLSRSTVIGASPAHRALAATFGARYLAV